MLGGLLFCSFIFGAPPIPETKHGNIIIKIGDGGGFEDGDIIHAFNSKKILDTHTQHIVHPKNMERNSNRSIKANSVLETYLENIHEYKFERMSEKEVKRTNLWTSEVDYVSDIPNMKGEYIDVPLYIERRLTLKPNQNKIFGDKGKEYWYGGDTKITNEKLDEIWKDIEKKTSYKKNDYVDFPFSEKELKKFFVIKTNDFTDKEAQEYMKNKIDWDKLNLNEEEMIAKNSKDILIDTRENRLFIVADIILEK